MVVASSTKTSLQNGTVDTTTPIASTSNGAMSFKMLPQGKYTLVGIDIDTTGRRLIDEIVQLAAYTPKDHFDQYIMPYMNLNPAARQRHQVRVISIGFYRMLKSMQTYKIIKSKSEIAALKDFLIWLEALKAKDINSLGCILVYHEERKFIPYMILESLKKYNLLDRFLHTVKSFANGLNLAKANSNEALQHYSLRKLLKVLSSKTVEPNNNNHNFNINNNNGNINNNNGNNHINNNHQQQNGVTSEHEIYSSTSNSTSSNGRNSSQQQQDRELFDGNASVRAKLAFEVGLQLGNQGLIFESFDSPGVMENFLAAIHPYANPVICDLNELQTQNENLERQNSFRPVFLNYFKTTLYHRVRAVKFRIILAEQGYDLPTLNAIWSERQKEGIVEVMQVIEELKQDDKTELTELFDSYFDPNKMTIKPIVKNTNRRRNRRGVRNHNNNNNQRSSSSVAPGEQGACGDKQVSGAAAAAAPQQQQHQQQQQQLPDSTTKSPTPSAVANNTGNGGGGGSKPQRFGGKRHPRSRNHSLKIDAPAGLAAGGGVAANNNNQGTNTQTQTQQQPPMPVMLGGPTTSIM